MPESQFVREIGVARILRYSYGGLLLLLLAAVIDPKATAPIISALGTILAPLVALGVGAGIYVVHRHVLGEMILYLALHFIHHLWDCIRGNTGVNSTDTVHYLKALGVKRGDRRAAYTAARRQFFDQAVRERLNIAHSELHMLWITVDETLVAAIYLAATGRSHQSVVLFAISGIIASCATIADIRQHHLECHMLKIAEREKKLSSFLKNIGYLPIQDRHKF